VLEINRPCKKFLLDAVAGGMARAARQIVPSRSCVLIIVLAGNDGRNSFFQHLINNDHCWKRGGNRIRFTLGTARAIPISHRRNVWPSSATHTAALTIAGGLGGNPSS
jgi:hypothetical protein